MTDIVLLNLADYHRTTFGKFLIEGVWNINYAWKSIKKFVVKTIIYGSSLESPIFAIYDDTISEKISPRQRLKIQFKNQVSIVHI